MTRANTNLNTSCSRSTDWSRTEAIELSLAESLRLLGHLPDIQLHDDPDALWILSDTPGQLNAVAQVRFHQEEADKRIEEILSHYREHDVACSWWLGPSATPGDLPNRLRVHGLTCLGRLVGMACELQPLGNQPHTTGNVKIQIVEDFSIFERFGHPYFGGSDTPYWRAQIDARAFLSRLEPRRLWHFAAFLKGKSVGAATLCLTEAIAGIYDVGVLKEFRGRGIGRVLILSILEFARKLGCTLAVVQATKTAEKLYREAGFRDGKGDGHQIWGR